MKKTFLSISLVCSLTSITQAQNVGIGTTTPKAAFNVAENKTVLFGNDTSGVGSKLMWIPSKYAFRVGRTGKATEITSQSFDSTIWDYDSIGFASFAAGFQNKATNIGSIAIGLFNQSTGLYSTSLGRGNINSCGLSFSAGRDNTTSGYECTTIGSLNHANGGYSTAIGYSNDVNSFNAVAIGYQNESNGHESFSFGEGNITYGNISTAIGIGNIANSYGMMALGVDNDTIAGSDRLNWINTDPLFMIGNGNGGGARNNAMTILKNGKTGFGTNTPAGLLHIKHNGQAANPQLVLEEAQNDYSRISFKNANPGYWNIEAYSKPLLGNDDVAKLNFFYSANGYILSLSGNGNATLTGTLYQNSDERLKQNITPIKNALNKLMQLSGYNYQWKDTARGKEEQVGLLAQEVEKQFPQLVMTDEKGKKSVAYANMVPILLQAIKEQQQQIDELKRLIAAGIK